MARWESEASSCGPLCELCAPPEEPRTAEWSCLTCQSSFCEAHARPHLGEDGGGVAGAAFRGHRVRPAQEAAEELRSLQELAPCCSDHRGRPLELFCEECALCVCALCPALGPHRGHRVSLVAQAARGKQVMMASCLKQLSLKKKQETDNTKHIEKAANDLKEHMTASKTWLTGKLAEIRLLFEEEEVLAKQYIEEKGQQILRKYEEQMEESERQIRLIDSFSDRIRQIQLRPDPLYLLKDYTTVEKEIAKQKIPAEQWVAVPISFEHLVNHVRRFVETIQSILRKPLKTRLKEDVFSSLDSTLKKEPGVLLKVNSCTDRLLFLKHARSPTLQLDTLHPRLTLSKDLLSVNCCWRWRFYPSSPQRFDSLWQVLSRDSFCSGSHYWEVDLIQAGQGWWIGATYPSIKRKGDSELCRLGWNRASWCIKRFDFEYWAFHNGEKIPIRTEDDPERVGVFLDYEAGLLSFYNITFGMAHLHTFRSKFTEPVCPALRLWEGTITIRTLT
ncbi:tripartite motif-containing protein 14 [Heteronotia binoei]|uniref:tripartite motif-containing protein 14 n=1 Tax=Heteronotia binoei TaxID=13085 RepID=UPI002930701B|nr:tripartite motif-containing protein 14 [Heteronotia binoei]